MNKYNEIFHVHVTPNYIIMTFSLYLQKQNLHTKINTLGLFQDSFLIQLQNIHSCFTQFNQHYVWLHSLDYLKQKGVGICRMLCSKQYVQAFSKI